MKAAIIYNPVAGQRDKQDEIRQVVGMLEQHGWDVPSLELAASRGDTTAQARAAAGIGCDAVFVAGGDGTVSRAVDGLVGTETALAVLPAGTANVLARQLNLPLPGGFRQHPMLDATQLILDGQARKVDVGRLSLAHGVRRHFLCWSGIGFDAAVAKNVDAEREQKRRLGMLAFALASLIVVRDYAGTRAIVRADGVRIRQRLIMLVANNIQLYGGWIRMAPDALLDDGWLDVSAFRGRNPWRTFWAALRWLANRNSQVPQVSSYRAQRVEIMTARPLPVHVDGDAIGYTPAVIEVVPQALTLLVPSSAPANLFVDGAGGGDSAALLDAVARLARDARSTLFGKSPLE